MKRLDELALAATPEWFRVRLVVPLPPALLGLPPALDLHLVEFGLEALETPGSEPIGVTGGRSGGRLYVWRDTYWMEYDLNWRAVHACVPLREHTELVRDSARRDIMAPDATEWTRVLARVPEHLASP